MQKLLKGTKYCAIGPQRSYRENILLDELIMCLIESTDISLDEIPTRTIGVGAVMSIYAFVCLTGENDSSRREYLI